MPFIDQILDRLAGRSFSCFMDGYSGYNQINIALENQEKTKFTCPYGTFAFSRMSFGLILLAECLGHGGRFLGVISKRPPPTSIKGVRSFLGHTEFYQRFIKDFSKIVSPMCKLPGKDAKFVFNDKCLKAFEELKANLTTGRIIVTPDWSLPFELMCDASGVAIGVVIVNDRKGTENQVVDHRSRLEEAGRPKGDLKINNVFPYEQLLAISSTSTPWYADIANFLISVLIPD
ncbi:uncharacterized mitochondrial protein AtMg00860-like [Nicotiana tomentosiformis]|uniref:uncharacterized mitochondrial protein AtMg00860-like n=1 Tax=Nicotiana tomentosiformis TaxID=4098 RepID=UPI00388CE896